MIEITIKIGHKILYADFIPILKYLKRVLLIELYIKAAFCLGFLTTGF
jgi:hypothetical protein